MTFVLTADHKFLMSQILMTSLKSVKKRRQQLHAHDVRGLVASCFYPLEESIVEKSYFPSFFKVQLC